MFGIAFAQLCKGRGDVLEQKYFRTVPKSMVSLFLGGTLPDLEGMVNEIGNVEVLYSILFLVFILLAVITVMNMLIGVLVQVVSVVSVAEKEEMEVAHVKSLLQDMLEDLDSNHDGIISKKEFHHLLEQPLAARTLHNIGVDVVGLVDFIDFIFAGQSLEFTQFMETVLALRGGNKATVKDMVDLRKFMDQELKQFSHQLKSFQTEVTKEIMTTVRHSVNSARH
jgi:hypothetical protein